MFLITGSRALDFHSKQDRINYLPPGKRVFDWDVICDMGSFHKWEQANSSRIQRVIPIKANKFACIMKDESPWEFEIAAPGTSAYSLLELVEDGEYPFAVRNGHMLFARPKLVMTLKMSHRYLKNSPHFYKTMADIRHLRYCGVTTWVEYHQWYKQRVRETYDYSHPNLNQKKSEFFDGAGIKYYYEHDDIHQAVAHLDKPAYEYYKIPNEEVKCSKELFYEVPEQTRLFGVMEEAYTLALERSQIPIMEGDFTSETPWTPEQSFKFALMKVCTSITSGWFREYAWEQHDRVLAMYDRNYATRFWDWVKQGKVKALLT